MATPLSDIRRNPISGAISFRVMDPEIHTIAELANFLPGIHGFRLQDRPEPGSVVVVENVTGGATFVQVTAAPLAGQVFVDAEGGLLIFHPSDTGKSIVVNYNGGGSAADLPTIQGLSGAFDEKLKISNADTTEGFGEDKIIAGANININKLNTGANEQLQIVAVVPPALNDKLKISVADTNQGFGENKIISGAGIAINKLNAGANEQLQISSAVGQIVNITFATIARQQLATGYTAIPKDDTLPDVNEGIQYASISITPLLAGSKLVFLTNASISENTNVGQAIVSALFITGTAAAIDVKTNSGVNGLSVNGGQIIHNAQFDHAHVGVATVYTLRASGGGTNVALDVNFVDDGAGSHAAYYSAGGSASSIICIEVKQ